MPKAPVVAESAAAKRGSGGRIVAIAILAILIGAAYWARVHFTANAASFQRYMEGVQLMQNGHAQDAVTLWEDLRLKDPEFPDTYFALATYYTNQGDPQHALDIIDGAKAEHIDTPELKLVLAEAYGRLNDKRAMAAAQAAVAALPNNYRSHLALATAYAQQFDYPHAVAQLQIAEQQNPRDSVLDLLGAEYISTGNDYARVEEQARKAVAINPNLAEAWYYIGWAIDSGPAADRLPEARTALEKSVSLRPGSFPTWLELGDVYWRLHMADDALKALTKARELGLAPLPGGMETEQRLQDRVRTAHLLQEVYHARGDAAGEARMQAESNELSAQIHKVIHTK